MEWIFSLENINQVAKEFWEMNKSKSVFAFHGSMGTGKTTFIHALCKEKAVHDIVGSPTFSIINEYEYICEGTKRKIFHIDLYRLKNEEEAIRAGVEDCFISGSVCLVEWPERAPGIFPENTTHTFISLLNNGTRKLIIANN